MNTSKNYFAGCSTNDDARNRYKELAIKLHPDVSGYDSTEDFQALQNQFENFKPSLKTMWEENADKSRAKAQKDDNLWYDWHNSIFMAVINQLIVLEAIEIRLAGDWLWVTGTTYEMRDKLNAIKESLPEGFKMRWQRKKKAWTICPIQFRKRTRREWSFEEIDNAFDSQKVVGQRQKQIA